MPGVAPGAARASSALSVPRGLVAAYGFEEGGWRTIVMKERSDGLLYALYASDDTSEPPAGYVHTGTDRRAAGVRPLPLGAWTHLATTYDSHARCRTA